MSSVSVEGKPYRFLDVYTKEQGVQRIGALASTIALLLVLSLFILMYGGMGWSIPDADTHDIIDDFRNTLPAVQRFHDVFRNDEALDAFTLFFNTPAGITNAFDLTITNSNKNSNIVDSRFKDLLGLLVRVPGTKHDSKIFNGTIATHMPAYQRDDMMLLSLGYKSQSLEYSVPIWTTKTNYDLEVVTVARLVAITIHLFKTTDGWGIHKVDTVYGEPWAGPVAHVVLSNPENKAVPLYVTVVDVNYTYADHPPFVAFWLVFVAILLSLCAICLAVFYSYCRYTINVNVHENSNLPPPFFASMTKYRGW